jgi:hypothetical protein
MRVLRQAGMMWVKRLLKMFTNVEPCFVLVALLTNINLEHNANSDLDLAFASLAWGK